MAKQEKYYFYTIIAIIAVVAVVGVAAILINMNSFAMLGLSSGDEINQLGEASRSSTACTDSDGGKNYYTFGYVTYNRATYYDTCNSSSLLVEMFCYTSNKKLVMGSEAYSCSYGCAMGACLPAPPCTDSDNGKNYYVKGLTQGMTPAGYFTNVSDYCVDSSILEEYYCYNSMVYDIRYSCGANYTCQNGICQIIQCINGQTKPCGASNMGECRYGTQTCANGVWGSCIGASYPSPEVCDARDNDCDGVVDEGLTASCTTPEGYPGTRTCAAGVWSACTLSTISETDTCYFYNYFNHTNYCYSSKGNCTGYGLCTAIVTGSPGDTLTWYSNCLGNPVSIIDGTGEYLYFNCTS
jgi:hypothetical protein